METFFIHSLFETIGEIDLQVCGLYYAYDARIQRQGEGILRCYYHDNGQRISLGVFIPDGGDFICRGRIACKYFQDHLWHGRFSVLERDWRPILSEDGHMYAMECTEEHPIAKVRKIACRRDGEFPVDFLPYFCFFQPEQIGVDRCLTLLLDERDDPVRPI